MGEKKSSLMPDAIPKNLHLGPDTFVRHIYRTLINSGRGYAAFQEDEIELLRNLSDLGWILDPMSGYGLTTVAASKLDLNTFSLEMNLPQYFWQSLTNPGSTKIFGSIIEKTLRDKKKWPRPLANVVTSENWYPEECLSILMKLLEVINENGKRVRGWSDDKSISLLLPFAGRFSCHRPATNSSHVKQGGICIVSSWRNDFIAYLEAIQARLLASGEAIETSHELFCGDATTYSFKSRKFQAMFTSPPYPNSRDYWTMFAPENVFLETIASRYAIPPLPDRNRIIGTAQVSGKEIRRTSLVKPIDFFREIRRQNKNQNAEYDDEKYYIPYFEAYFSELHSAYKNVAKSLDSNFLGYISIANNTHRNVTVPLDKIVSEIWKSLGYQTKIVRRKEKFHFGTKNPAARGRRAKQTYYIIEISSR